MAADNPRPDVAPDGTFILDNPVALPEVLDMLVVGGGPFGTAAAFRAKERGLAALVIDYDDLMKRIRDYAKEKLILPDFGGGDLMQFPEGGPLIQSLQFGPIDKDDMCAEWKGFYRKFNVPAQIGVEMTGLEREGDIWRVTAWNHNTLTDISYRARHVVLAFGRGVPRRLEIPGNVEGLAFGLADATKYVGQPVCVVGGGTSAAEAVIAISNAKSAASDTSAVYWSYRLDKMPKVSRALAEVFFSAFVQNGNVRYLPKSEPVAMIESDGEQYLTVRTTRVPTPDGPMQTTQLEFRKRYCIACIGEEIPKALLEKIGIPLVTGGPTNRERIVVSPLLETRQPNVYLAGDILSPAYFETTSFDADPATFLEVKRRGNIKASLRDGVAVAEVVAQKLEAQKGGAKTLHGSRVELTITQPPPPSPDVSCGRLITVLPSGVDADEYQLKRGGTTTIGRQGADITFKDDATLADIHAAITAETEERYVLVDKGSEQGVFVQPKPDRGVPVEPGMIVRAGRQWLVIGDPAAPRKLMHYDAAGRLQGTHMLQDGANLIGRQSPNITLAADDPSLSRRHLLISVESRGMILKDIGSSNGTLVKVRGSFRLADGDRLLIGRQVLRFDDESRKARPSSVIKIDLSEIFAPGPPPPAPMPAPAPVAQRVAEPPPVVTPQVAADAPKTLAVAIEPTVFFVGVNRQIPCMKNQTIFEVAEKAGVQIKADCHGQGLCGEDPVRVVSGAEFLNPISAKERGTLEDICSKEPGKYRLSCMARVSGPVSVEIVKQQ
jgi:thioredoxin reductase/ferredoxin/pSer/pThr/pTyr-binding forkhead associated (FHA) protein